MLSSTFLRFLATSSVRAAVALCAPIPVQNDGSWQLYNLDFKEDYSKDPATNELTFQLFRPEHPDSLDRCALQWQGATTPNTVQSCPGSDGLSFKINRWDQNDDPLTLDLEITEAGLNSSAKKGTVHLVATEEEAGDGQEKLACTRNNAGRTFECRMMGPKADFSGPLSIQPEDV